METKNILGKLKESKEQREALLENEIELLLQYVEANGGQIDVRDYPMVAYIIVYALSEDGIFEREIEAIKAENGEIRLKLEKVEDGEWFDDSDIWDDDFDGWLSIHNDNVEMSPTMDSIIYWLTK